MRITINVFQKKNTIYCIRSHSVVLETICVRQSYFGWSFYILEIKIDVRVRSTGAFWKPGFGTVRVTGQFEKTLCVNIIGTGWFWKSLCVNLIVTGDLKDICTENVTGTDTFEKIEYGYGIRTRLRIPESAQHPIPISIKESPLYKKFPWIWLFSIFTTKK